MTRSGIEHGLTAALSEEAWMTLIADADATYCSDSVAAARVILMRNPTEEELSKALIAYARLLHQCGVVP